MQALAIVHLYSLNTFSEDLVQLEGLLGDFPSFTGTVFVWEVNCEAGAAGGSYTA